MKLSLILMVWCSAGSVISAQNAKQQRFIFYDVNPGEGFNLRRDVFMRMAVMVKKLNDKSLNYNYILVLPAWGPLYHWQTQSLGDTQVRIPWKSFFDVSSISRYVPSIDLEDYLKST